MMANRWDTLRLTIATLLAGVVVGVLGALFIGTLPAGYGVPWFFLLPSGIVVLIAVHRFLGKPVDHPDDTADSRVEVPPI